MPGAIMPVAISVGPQTLTINQGGTFVVTDLAGEIAAASELGVFANDTRFVSQWASFLNGESWGRLTSSTRLSKSPRARAVNTGQGIYQFADLIRRS